MAQGRHERHRPIAREAAARRDLPDMTKDEIDEARARRRWKQLADLYLAQQLFNYPAGLCVAQTPRPSGSGNRRAL